MVDPAQTLACAVSGAVVGIVCDGAGNAGALHQQCVKAVQLAAAAGQCNAGFGNVADQFGAGLLDRKSVV